MVPSTMNVSFFSGPKPSASHALVDFGDEGTTIIPFLRIVGDKSALAENTGSTFAIIMHRYMLAAQC